MARLGVCCIALLGSVLLLACGSVKTSGVDAVETREAAATDVTVHDADAQGEAGDAQGTEEAAPAEVAGPDAFEPPEISVAASCEEDKPLALVQTLAQDEGGIDGLVLPRAVDVSPDGRFAYVGSAQAISWFERKQDSSVVTPAGAYVSSPDNGYVLGNWPEVKLSPGGEFIYVADGSPCPLVFARDAGSGGVTLLQDGDCMGQDEEDCEGGEDCPCYPESIAVSPDGKSVYGWMGSVEGDVFGPVFAVYAVDPIDGTLQMTQADWWQRCPDLDPEEEEFWCEEMPGSALVSPDSSHVYMVWPGVGIIEVYARDKETGKLTLAGTAKLGEAGVPGDSLGWLLTMSSSGKHLYVSGGQSVSVFARDLPTGQLKYLQTVPIDPGGGDFWWAPAEDMLVDGSEDRLLVLTRFGVAIYPRDQPSGQLGPPEYVTVWDPYNNFVLDMALSPGGDLLFVTRQEWDTLDVLKLCGTDLP